jgi:hypothetical protein
MGEVRDVLSGFVQAIVTRLRDQDVGGTFLAEEWDSISAADGHEARFCAAAAALGLDPYALSPEQGAHILEAGSQLPPPVSDEFFFAADSSRLGQQTGEVLQALEDTRRNAADLRPLERLRVAFEHPPPAHWPPWDQGYHYARRLRQEVGLNSDRLDSIDALAAALRVDPAQLQAAVLDLPADAPAFGALVGRNATGSPAFVLTKRSRTAERFLICRALCEYLASPSAEVALVTAARSERQKRNRAFAAELLAPEAALRAAIGNVSIGPEDIDRLGEVFGVSATVIEHQIENHRITTLLRD